MAKTINRGIVLCFLIREKGGGFYTHNALPFFVDAVFGGSPLIGLRLV